MFIRSALALLLVVGCVCSAVAQEEEGKTYRESSEPAGSIELVADRGADIKAALDTDEFRLPADIGELIDKARTSGDPADTWDVALALQMAESASGNVSEIVTSTQLIEEATDKARRVGDSCALLMAAAANLRAGDEAAYDALLTEYHASPTPEGIGEKAGRHSFDLRVENHSYELVALYVDGAFWGYIDDGWNTTWTDLWTGYYYLYAVGMSSGGWWEWYMYGGPFDTCVWKLWE